MVWFAKNDEYKKALQTHLSYMPAAAPQQHYTFLNPFVALQAEFTSLCFLLN